MNTIGYAILSVLNQEDCSGYDLAEHLEALWPAKHSQIYPTLTKMHKKGLLTFEYVEQIGKPNKKLFSITEKGREVLEKWVSETEFSSVTRDEFLIKVYSIGLLDEEAARKLIQERMTNIENSIISPQERLAESETDIPDRKSREFAKYILHERKLRLAKEEAAWCNWVMSLLEHVNLKSLPIWCISIGQLNLSLLEKTLSI